MLSLCCKSITVTKMEMISANVVRRVSLASGEDTNEDREMTLDANSKTDLALGVMTQVGVVKRERENAAS